MKILVIQLARLGDILLTWPQVRALRRLYPDAQIDMLVRPRFRVATKNLDALNEVIDFPVNGIFEPLLQEPLELEKGLHSLNELIESLRSRKYDWIINSTLSPASSYLMQALEGEETRLTGYTRTSDGYLAITDDLSAYIYAQVGIDRDNRIHLSDLFTMMVGAEPCQEDWHTPVTESSPVSFTDYIVLHVGASRPEKKFSAFKWRTFISHFHKTHDLPIVLIGNEEETKDSAFIALGFDNSRVLDLTGKLSFEALFPLISHAKAYLGCDSAPLHIASLTGTPALNISLRAVNFWETGPRSNGSRVLYAESEADLPSENVARELISLLNGESPQVNTITLQTGTPCYQAPANTRNSDWTWQTLKALYMGGEWPLPETQTQRQGLKNILDINGLIMNQLTSIRKTKSVRPVSGIVERCEEVIESVGRLVPELSPLIRWYQTQKTIIGPGSAEQILTATEKVHADLDSIVQYWLTIQENNKETTDGTSQS